MAEFAGAPVWLWPLLAAPFVGSFLGVLILRLPQGRDVVFSRSACQSCGRRLGARELAPLLSYAWQRGRCRGCGAAIGAFHWQVEAAALLVACVVAASVGEAGKVWADCGLGWTLLALGWIDARHGRLPDALTLPLCVAGLAATWGLAPERLLDHAIGAVLGYALFRLVALAYRALRGREGLGRGDAKLMAAAGAWVGWQGLNQVVLLGALATIAAVLVMAARRGGGLSRSTSAPFGPGLAAALLAVRLWGG